MESRRFNVMAGPIFYLLVLGLPVLAPPILVAAAGTQSDRDRQARQIMTVNGRPITLTRFKHSYLQHLLKTGRNDTRRNREAHLDNLAATFLLADEARRRGFDHENDFLAFKNRQLKLAVGARYFEKAFAKSLPPLTEEETREAFRRSKEKVALRHLFFRDPEEALKAYRRLENGEDFLTPANEVFQTASFDSTAGYLGFASYWELDDAVALAAYELPVGSYSRPVRSKFGWHILRVEDRLVNPVLTESEFQVRRSGIEAMARIRRNRVEGDEFIRRMMDGVNVSVNPEGVRLAEEAIEAVLKGREDQEKSPPPVSLSESEVAFIRETLDPNTPLMTFTVDGQRHTFTAGDLQAWLPELSYVELRDHPVAAVERALRNEVLALKGFDSGLETDPGVQETLQFLTTTYLARRLRDELDPLDPLEIPAEKVRQAYLRLGYRELESAHADWWEIRFGTLAEADSALEAIESGERTPESFRQFASHRNADLAGTELGDYVRLALKNRPMLVCTSATACYVIRVDNLDLEYATLEESEDEIRSELSRRLPEVELLANLREDARIKANSELLDEALHPY